MREIKFRFWDGEKMDYEGNDVTIWHGFLVCEGDTIPMQFTGLKDENGVEIYEADIVKIGTILCSVVNWDSRRAKFVVDLTPGTWHDLGQMESIEVIGNIYENADLLEA